MFLDLKQLNLCQKFKTRVSTSQWEYHKIAKIEKAIAQNKDSLCRYINLKFTIKREKWGLPFKDISIKRCPYKLISKVCWKDTHTEHCIHWCSNHSYSWNCCLSFDISRIAEKCLLHCKTVGHSTFQDFKKFGNEDFNDNNCPILLC